MDIEGIDIEYRVPLEELEYVEMTTPELASALREGAVIEAAPTHDLRYEVSLEGVLQVVIAAMGSDGAAQLRTALSASLDGTSTATVQTGVAIPLDDSLDRAQAALLVRALDALAIVTGS
ncbi:hypothetical protein ACFRMQ_00115 [Kitasatospora sp. NPDC056783]|uniref:hypothetical protein n=1 Tax=Kitasatospora sp. NPDC056783 TaxID=3345943 RepID=UPI0036812F92